jgi:segregation and condensation protein B
MENLEEKQGIASKEELANIIQALIFASPDTVTLKKLKDLIGDFLEIQAVRDSVILSNELLTSINSPFEIVEQAKGFRFRTRKRYYSWIKKLFSSDQQIRKLSQAGLETLSIIAYKQPITKAEMESVRGVSCDGPLKSLLDKKLIALGGRSESVGQAFQYITTKEFLKYFGLNKIPDDLPRLQELDDLIHANELIPQIKGGKVIPNFRDESDPNQTELSMGDH